MVPSAVIDLIDPDAAALADFERVLVAAGYAVRASRSAASFLSLERSNAPGCVVMDPVRGDVGGIEFQERLRESAPAIPIVFASTHADVRLIVRAMRAGAIDFLQKPVADAALLEAVRRAAEAAVALREAEAQRLCALERFDLLTPRERAIFAEVLQGRLNKQIASALDCQEATVKVHRSRLMRKLGVRSVARLVQFARDFGLDEPGRAANAFQRRLSA